MNIVVHDRGLQLQSRLRQRLEQAGALRCTEHHQPIVAVTIHARENGWFDSTWTTCCEALERKAMAIVRDRC